MKNKVARYFIVSQTEKEYCQFKWLNQLDEEYCFHADSIADALEDLAVCKGNGVTNARIIVVTCSDLEWGHYVEGRNLKKVIPFLYLNDPIEKRSEISKTMSLYPFTQTTQQYSKKDKLKYGVKVRF